VNNFLYILRLTFYVKGSKQCRNIILKKQSIDTKAQRLDLAISITRI